MTQYRATCTSGHGWTWMNAPFYTSSPGPLTLWGNSECYCHCGARVWGNPPRRPR